ncbi:MAG: 30S ribosomal protein S20 [Caldilineaceae bacterium]|nr:30S ribosomal protein S20 [Caldilineaceae bacterium]MBP8293646.1 30S ribosomal protein S20 [Caldilineaceae bacterium]
MANIKSAEKRNRQSQKRAASNRIYRSAARTAVKKARIAVAGGDPNAGELVKKAEVALAKAAGKGVIHPNNAARRTSRLAQAYSKQTA